MFIWGHCLIYIYNSIDPEIAINIADYPEDHKLNLPNGITIINSIHDADRSWTQIPEIKIIRQTPPPYKGIRF